MSNKHKYTEEKRRETLRVLMNNQGNIALTSQQTGVPPRTLRDWRTRYCDMHLSVRSKETETKPTVYEQLTTLRDSILHHMSDLAQNLGSDDDLVAQRAIAITRLLDRIIRLDDLLRKQDPDKEQVWRFEYVYNGATHLVPPWKSKEGRWRPDLAREAIYEATKHWDQYEDEDYLENERAQMNNEEYLRASSFIE